MLFFALEALDVTVSAGGHVAPQNSGQHPGEKDKSKVESRKGADFLKRRRNGTPSVVDGVTSPG